VAAWTVAVRPRWEEGGGVAGAAGEGSTHNRWWRSVKKEGSIVGAATAQVGWTRSLRVRAHLQVEWNTDRRSPYIFAVVATQACLLPASAFRHLRRPSRTPVLGLAVSGSARRSVPTLLSANCSPSSSPKGIKVILCLVLMLKMR
jgi:hypothetical protein